MLWKHTWKCKKLRKRLLLRENKLHQSTDPRIFQSLLINILMNLTLILSLSQHFYLKW
jgi:hypothetical protein